MLLIIGDLTVFRPVFAVDWGIGRSSRRINVNLKPGGCLSSAVVARRPEQKCFTLEIENHTVNLTSDGQFFSSKAALRACTVRLL